MRTPKNHLPPTPSISAIARARGVSRESVRKWKSEGVNLSDGKAVSARVEAMQKTSASPDLAARKKEKIEVEIARLRHQLAVDQKRFVDAGEVLSEGRRMGQLVREALTKLTHELPPALGGRDAMEIHGILKNTFREILSDLSKRASSITFDHD